MATVNKNHSDIKAETEIGEGNSTNLNLENVAQNSYTQVDGKCLGKSTQVDGKSEGKLSGQNVIQSCSSFSLTKTDDDAYSMKYGKRGHCIIFNVEKFSKEAKAKERDGASIDSKGVKSLFEGFGFEVAVYNDLNKEEIKNILRKYQKKIDHADRDCFVVFFMSHGESGDKLLAKDGKFPTEDLFKKFSAENCPSLRGKPKMFFIQACRGYKVDSGSKLGTELDSSSTLCTELDSDSKLDADLDSDSELYSVSATDNGFYLKYEIFNEEDFLICWSTVPGHYSFRNPENGSWFIQSLIKVFTNKANDTDVLSMMTVVNRYMTINYESKSDIEIFHKRKQSAFTVSTLMRQVYLVPQESRFVPLSLQSLLPFLNEISEKNPGRQSFSENSNEALNSSRSVSSSD